MPASARQLELVVVYDDTEAEALTRTGLIRTLLSSLCDDGTLAEMPELISATLRPECLDALAEGRNALLIADLMSTKRAPKGARLLRAVASREGVREHTWRIALTKRSHPAVATGLDGYAHAVVVHPPDGDTEALGQAIREVIRVEPSSAYPARVYPHDLVERYPRDLDRALQQVFLGPYTQELAEAAFREIADHPVGVQATRDTKKEPRWIEVDASSTRLHRELRKRWGADLPTDTLHDLLLQHLYPVSDEGVWQQINPQSVAIGMSDEVMIALSRYERSSQQIWLTRGEYDLACAFLAAARAKRATRGTITSTRAFTSVDDALLEENYVSARAETGLTDWDTCYAVLTIDDWWFDRKRYEQRLKVG